MACSPALNGQACGLQLCSMKPGSPDEAKWVIAEGADAAAMSRSVPLEKCLDDAMVALYQNGEAIRPEQGYPMRLLLPGFEGNMNVKWLRRLNVTDAPVNARDETSHYTELMPNGKARQFMFPHGSEILNHQAVLRNEYERARVIRNFRTGMVRGRPGFQGRGVRGWRKNLDARGVDRAGVAESSDPVPPAVALGWASLNPDEPSHRFDRRRAANQGRLGRLNMLPGQIYHFNGIQSWGIDAEGTVKNVYA